MTSLTFKSLDTEKIPADICKSLVRGAHEVWLSPATMEAKTCTPRG